MLGIVRAWYGAKRAELQMRREAASLQESLFNNYNDIANRYVDVDRLMYGFSDGLSSTLAPNARLAGLQRARDESREFVRVNAHARNVCTQIVNFTVGAGFAVHFEDAAQAIRWHKDSRALRWPKRRREIVRRLVREGEAYLRRFGNGDGTTVRFVQPEHLYTPTGQIDNIKGGLWQGVAFDPEDVETVLGYWINEEYVDAGDVFVFRDPFSDTTAIRGWPMIYDAIPLIEQYQIWVQTRGRLNQLRSAIVAMRKHTNTTPAQLSSFADAVKTGTLTRKSGVAQKYTDKWLPGTVIDATGDIEYEFPAAKIDAGSAADDGRAMRLLIAAFFSMPEYWVTADASNANFSSTLIAENPGIIAMRSWQEFFGDDVQQFVDWWYGSPQATKVKFPNLVMRDELKQTQAQAIRHDHGVISRETWQEQEGIDPEIERERMAQGGEEA